MILYYIRHGDPIYNPDSLTPLGLRQAEAVGRRLAMFGVDEVYASSSNRAIQTANPTCELLHLKPTILDWCNESHAWHDLTVKTESGSLTWGFAERRTRRVFTSPEMQALGQEWYRHPIFEGTNFESGYKRILGETRNFLSGLGYVYEEDAGCYRCEAPSSKRVALFAHQGFGLAFLSAVLGIPYPYFSTHFDICHTGFSVISFQESDGYSIPKMLEFSSDAHLYKDGLPLAYNNGMRL